MSELLLSHISKSYPNNPSVIQDFSLEIQNNDFIILVGPSGCGKSTVLRMIAGLESISSGKLYSDGRLLNHEEPQKRNFAMIFQNYALYPHMTVYDNMAFGLRVHGMSDKEIKQRVEEAAAVLGIEKLLDRKPRALSGGQKQRVAIGSAIVRRPDAYLMDEPLSNLDAKMRVQMRVEIAKLHHSLPAPFIYVTHDQAEAMTLGTRIVVMKDGVIQQTAGPGELYRSPANLFTAGFIGSPSMNFLKAEFRQAEENFCLTGKGWSASFSGTELSPEKRTALFNKKLIIGIRPENLKPDYADGVEIPVHISLRELNGADAFLHGKSAGGETLCIRIPGASPLRAGEEVRFSCEKKFLYFFDAATGKNLML